MKRLKSIILLLCCFLLLTGFTPIKKPVLTKEGVVLVETYTNGNEIFEKYIYSRPQDLNSVLLIDKGVSTQSIGPSFPWRHSYTYGSFEGGDVLAITGILVGLMGFPYTAAAAGIAAILFKYQIIYYTSIYSQKRENGILYVRQEWIFYSNSSRTNRLTNYVINREYTNDGMD